MTLKAWIEKLHATDRIAQEATRPEVAEALDIIAEDMMAGRASMLHCATLQSLAHAMRSPSEQDADLLSLEAHLSNLGRKGGSAKTPAKRAASAANGAKGGRPRVIFDDGEFSVTLSGHKAVAKVLGRETGRWELADSEIAAIEQAVDSQEVVEILEE